RAPAVCVIALVVVSGALGATPRASNAAQDAAGGQGDVPSIAISRQLREAQGLSVGGIVQLSSDPSGSGARRFRTAGVYEPIPAPLRLGATRPEVRLHLPDLIAMSAANSVRDGSAPDPLEYETVDAINVLAADPVGGRALAGELNATLP